MIGIYSVPSKAGRLLATSLNLPIYYKKQAPLTTIINWGRTGNIPTASRIINNPQAVYKASNKQLSRFIFENAGVPVPMNGTKIFPVVGRPVKHSQGKNFFYCKSIDDVIQASKKGAIYFSQYFPKVREYRVHATPTTIIAIAEKIGGNYDSHAWNHTNDFYFKYVKRLDVPGIIRTTARHAVDALGLDFSACDIGIDNEGNVAVFECNTTPALSDHALNKYINFFNKTLYESDNEYEEDNSLY